MIFQVNRTILGAKFSSAEKRSTLPRQQLGGRWVLLVARGSITTLPFSAFSDYVTFSSRVEMPALVVGLSL